MIDKKIVAYFLTVLISTGTYTVWNLNQQRKITKRMKRNAAFLTESEALKTKYEYPEEPEDSGKAMTAELLDLMKKYEL